MSATLEQELEQWRQGFTRRHPLCLRGCAQADTPFPQWTDQRLAEEVVTLRSQVAALLAVAKAAEGEWEPLQEAVGELDLAHPGWREWTP